ncbi:RNA polymerase III Rpc4 [Cordyceps militaris]|uniref:RNA polymerase III Rpc4 n=1 Tax=Cordyceps militaris TaxID=73501 RepID=A0A2H4S855_CORMI|nr:RNA polymerase III Rpc4 [Cordyceps militaris]
MTSCVAFAVLATDILALLLVKRRRRRKRRPHLRSILFLLSLLPPPVPERINRASACIKDEPALTKGCSPVWDPSD